MPSLVKRDGSKAHNWPTGKTIEKDADEVARRFIASCDHLTPAREAELDNLLWAMPKPEHEPKTDTPNAEVLAQLNAPDDADSWMNDEPTNADLDSIETE